MLIIEVIAGVAVGVLVGWLASIERRISKMNNKLNEVPMRDEVTQTVSLKLEKQEALNENIRDDIKSLEAKIDKIYEAVLKKL